MKRTISILTLGLALLCGTASLDAKTPVKSKSKAKAKTTATTQAAPIKRNADGYANPGGHTYSCTLPDRSKFRFTFSNNGAVTLVCTVSSGKQIKGSGSWTQAGDYVAVYDEYGNPMLEGSISDDGKKILGESVYGETYDLRLVK